MLSRSLDKYQVITHHNNFLRFDKYQLRNTVQTISTMPIRFIRFMFLK
jgi:hypothetical protein